MQTTSATRLHVFLGIAADLLGVGMAIDLGFIQPQVRQMQQLGLQRDQLLDQIGQGLDRNRLGKELAAYLNVADLNHLLQGEEDSDPPL